MIAVLLTACGGGGGGGDGGDGGGGSGGGTQSYTVGGTVTGLSGTGLVLQNNGGDDLPVSSSGNFTFVTSIASGAGYAVTVRTQPSNPTLNNTIRKITPAGVVNTLAGTADQDGADDGSGSAALFRSPQGLDTDSAGNVYLADTGNHTIRKITPAGVVSTLAGAAGQEGSDDGIGSAARFSSPSDVVVDAAGNVYVADSANSAIRRITPDGTVTTVAGTPTLLGVRLGPLPGSLSGPKYIALLPGPRVRLAQTDAEKGILLITLP